MFGNYLKTALRNLLRHKLFSLINIAGLAIGLTCAILIGLYVFDELSYDGYHADADRIYRVSRDFYPVHRVGDGGGHRGEGRQRQAGVGATL